MNKQHKGDGKRGIEWTDYTWNPVGGCKHACRWAMPDGTIAKCYAEAVAEGVASPAYPDGFQAHYWHPQRLNDPTKVKESARIFLDSMSDLMGAWVPQEHVEYVLATVERCYWHEFQLLTKAPARILKYADQLPDNLWIGVSMPPSFMMGKRLSADQQMRYMTKTMDVFEELRNDWRKFNTLWLSLEPLSFDVAPLLRADAVDWIVIGAATNGPVAFQPDPAHVQNVLDFADRHEIPVFFKGNLKWSPWREVWPDWSGDESVVRS